MVNLSGLLEPVSGWALEYPRLIVLGDFSVHANDATTTQAIDLVSSMLILGLSQFILAPTHQVGHTLDLICIIGIEADVVTIDAVPWSDHFAPKAQLSIPSPPCLGGKLVYVNPQRLMEPTGFQKTLQGSSLLGGSLEELVEDWNTHFIEAINVIFLAPMERFFG